MEAVTSRVPLERVKLPLAWIATPKETVEVELMMRLLKISVEGLLILCAAAPFKVTVAMLRQVVLAVLLQFPARVRLKLFISSVEPVMERVPVTVSEASIFFVPLAPMLKLT